MKVRVSQRYIYDYSKIKYNKEFIEIIKNSKIEVFQMITKEEIAMNLTIAMIKTHENEDNPYWVSSTYNKILKEIRAVEERRNRKQRYDISNKNKKSI